MEVFEQKRVGFGAFKINIRLKKEGFDEDSFHHKVADAAKARSLDVKMHLE